jgi:osmotically-inducible protein OsmY
MSARPAADSHEAARFLEFVTRPRLMPRPHASTTQENPMKASRLLHVTALSVALGVTVLSTACSTSPSGSSSSAGEVIDDSWITTKVKAAYAEDKTVSMLGIGVDTNKGIVQLSGFANNQNEISRAVELARGIKGVKSVKNDIRLKSAG